MSGSVMLPPQPWESRIRKVLTGDICIEEAVNLPPAGETEGYSPEVFRGDLILLDKLNKIYKATRNWRTIEFGMDILGGPGRILHIGGDFDWEAYAAACETEERLVTPREFLTAMDMDGDFDIQIELPEELKNEIEADLKECEDAFVRPEDRAVAGPEPVGPVIEAGPDVNDPPDDVQEVVEAVPAAGLSAEEVDGDDEAGTEALRPGGPAPELVPTDITPEEAMSLVPNKALILGRSVGQPYQAANERFCRREGRTQPLTPREYADWVIENGADLRITRECHLQMSTDLRTLDELLTMNELNRTNENRRAFIEKLLGMGVEVAMVIGTRMFPLHYILKYRKRFKMEDLARFNTRIKCNSDCLSCSYFRHTLALPLFKLGRI